MNQSCVCLCVWDFEDELRHLNKTIDYLWASWVFFLSSSPVWLLRELKGVVTSLSSDGRLLCSYMGTDPSFFSTPKVDAREADYEQVEAEMRKLQKLIREATRTQGRRAAGGSLTGSHIGAVLGQEPSLTGLWCGAFLVCFVFRHPA